MTEFLVKHLFGRNQIGNELLKIGNELLKIGNELLKIVTIFLGAKSSSNR
jgi:hypothetical protein